MAVTLNVLHVEDASEFRLIVAGHLKALKNYQFEIVCLETAAIDGAPQTSFDLAIVDFKFEEGRGRTFVARLRKIDPLMPIIALSSAASEEAVRDLMKAGVDEHFDKSRLEAEPFQRAVLASLERGQNWRGSGSHVIVGRRLLELRVAGLRESLARFADSDLRRQIEEIASLARKANLDVEALRKVGEAMPRGVAESNLAADLWRPLWAAIARDFAKPPG